MKFRDMDKVSWSGYADLYTSSLYHCLYLYLYRYHGITTYAYYKNGKGETTPQFLWGRSNGLNIEQWGPLYKICIMQTVNFSRLSTLQFLFPQKH